MSLGFLLLNVTRSSRREELVVFGAQLRKRSSQSQISGPVGQEATCCVRAVSWSPWRPWFDFQHLGNRGRQPWDLGNPILSHSDLWIIIHKNRPICLTCFFPKMSYTSVTPSALVLKLIFTMLSVYVTGLVVYLFGRVCYTMVLLLLACYLYFASLRSDLNTSS